MMTKKGIGWFLIGFAFLFSTGLVFAADEPTIKVDNSALMLKIRNAQYEEVIQNTAISQVSQKYQQALNSVTAPSMQAIAVQEKIIGDAKAELLAEALKKKQITNVDEWDVDTYHMVLFRKPKPPADPPKADAPAAAKPDAAAPAPKDSK